MTLPSMQRSLLGLMVLMIIGLMIFLLSKRHTLQTRRRDGLFLDMIANISGNLDRLDNGFNDITAQTGIMRNRLRQLVALHRENLFACAILGEKQKQRSAKTIVGDLRKDKPVKKRRRFAVS